MIVKTMRIHRFYFPETLQIKEKMVISDIRLVHQLTRVLRAQIVDQILLFNGQGSEAQAVILAITSSEITVAIQDISEKPNQISRDVALYCALLKRDNFELVIQKATELGVGKIVPLLTHHVVKQGFRRDRLESIMLEAAEQCGRVRIPILESPVAFVDALEKAKLHEQAFFCDIDAPALANTKVQNNVGIFIGPEGGWAPEERDQAEQHNLIMTSLSPLTLRAETAALVAVHSLVNA